MLDPTVIAAQHALSHHMEEVYGKALADHDSWGQAFIKLWVAQGARKDNIQRNILKIC